MNPQLTQAIQRQLASLGWLDKQGQDFIAEYYRFCADKAEVVQGAGFNVRDSDLHPSLFPHQKESIKWALARGRGLIAASFGMGKTRMQIEILRQVQERTRRKVLVICPLGVRHQFSEEDGPALGVTFQYVTSDEQIVDATTNYLITNYERVRDGNITTECLTEHIGGVTLDEGAIIGNLGTKTQQNFSAMMKDMRYRWVATATPAPNDYKQLIYFADFLGDMDAGQALTRWFGRNPDKAGDLQLLPHMEEEFWLWVASWALFVTMPSDLGYSDDGYVMPELEIRWHRLTADHAKAHDLVDSFGQHFLFKDTAAGVTQATREKRDSMEIRVQRAKELIDEAAPDEHFVIWHDLEDERRMIKKAIPEATELYGSQDIDLREQLTLDFSRGKKRILATKPQISGSGSNFQKYCHRAIYLGVGYKFRDFIQSIHRLQRFGQTERVIVDIIHTDAEDNVVRVLQNKWQRHNELVARMRGIIQRYGLTNEALVSGLQRNLGVTRAEKTGTLYTAVNNDTVIEMTKLADNSVGEIVTSIPFGNHYEYVASYNDFGHNPTDDNFWRQMDFLVPNLLRVLKPGRMACIHVKDRLLYGHQTPHGMMEVDAFSDDCVRSFRKHGFVFYGRVTIPTDVVRENSSTNRLGWTENSKDGTKMGTGMPEYVLLFRKPQTDKSRSYADEPVRKDKPQTWFECAQCGHKIKSLSQAQTVLVQEWIDGDEDPTEREICPNCGAVGKFQRKHKGGYSRARWQIDAHQLWRSDGKTITPWEDPEVCSRMDSGALYRWYTSESPSRPYDYEQHVKFNEAVGESLPATFSILPAQAPDGYDEFVWTDILFMRTLNAENARRRIEKHVCPLPIDIVKRLIVRYSNPGDLVLDPFAGLFTVPYVALKLGRQAYGVELNPVYYDAGCAYCEKAEVEISTPTLFDLDAVADVDADEAVEWAIGDEQ